jgi:hypothetical protein
MDQFQVLRGLRRLGKAELVPDAQLPTVRERLKSKGLLTCAVGGPDSGFSVVYYAHEERTLDRARLCEDQQRVRNDEEARSRATRELGTMLGYPSCCVEHFSSAASHRDPDIFALLKGGLGRPTSALFNFFVRDAAPMGFVPCALDCPQAAARARQVLDAVCDAYAIDRQKYLQALKSVVLWFSGPFFIELLGVDGQGTAPISYGAVASSLERCRLYPELGAHPHAAVTRRWQGELSERNRLEVRPDSVVVYEEDGVSTSLPAPSQPHGWFSFVLDDMIS